MYGILLNLALAIFNLLPFYPLDGNKILELILKPENKFLQWLQRFSTIIVLVLLVTGLLSMVVNAAVNFVGQGLVVAFTALFEAIF